MALIDLEAREIHAKIVYFGPELSGKTTTLRAIAEGVPPETRGAFRSIASESARTIFSDSLPIDLGERLGFRLHWHLYTVPGQPRSSGARAAVLQGVDGIVFVADSAPLRMAENMASLAELNEMLAGQGKIAGELPGRAGVQQGRPARRNAPHRPRRLAGTSRVHRRACLGHQRRRGLRRIARHQQAGRVQTVAASTRYTPPIRLNSQAIPEHSASRCQELSLVRPDFPRCTATVVG